MKPGVTHRQAASRVSAAGSASRGPMTAITPSLIPTSNLDGGDPRPSKTRPFLIIRSSMIFSRRIAAHQPSDAEAEEQPGDPCADAHFILPAFERCDDRVIEQVRADVNVQDFPLAVVFVEGGRPVACHHARGAVGKSVGVSRSAVDEAYVFTDEFRQGVRRRIERDTFERSLVAREESVEVGLEVIQVREDLLVDRGDRKLVVEQRRHRIDVSGVHRLGHGLEHRAQLVVDLVPVLSPRSDDDCGKRDKAEGTTERRSGCASFHTPPGFNISNIFLYSTLSIVMSALRADITKWIKSSCSEGNLGASAMIIPSEL